MQSFTAATYGTVLANTPTVLVDPMTGNSAEIPPASCVTSVLVYRDGNNAVSDGCSIKLGTQANAMRMVSDVDGFTTTDLNTNLVLHKTVLADKGNDVAVPVYVELSSELSLGSVYFQIFYVGIDVSSYSLSSMSTTTTTKGRGGK